MKLANIAKSSDENKFPVIFNKKKYIIIQDIRPGINAAVRAWEDMILYFIKLFYFILVFIVINAIAMSNLRAENSILRNDNSVEISDQVYSATKTIVTQFQKLDGRKSLLRKLQFANKLKKPYLTPLKKGFDIIDNSPIGKQLNLIDKGFAIIKAADELAQWATGEDTSPTAFTDSIVELSAFDPTGLSSIAKSQVYDRIVEINNKMDDIRENEQKADEAFQEMSSIFLGNDFILSIASKLSYESVQTEEDAENLVTQVHSRYNNAIKSAIILLNQHIQGIKNSMPDKLVCLGLCVAQMEEAAGRITLMLQLQARLSLLLNENNINEMWDAVGAFIAADTAETIVELGGGVVQLSTEVKEYKLEISKKEEDPGHPIDLGNNIGDQLNDWDSEPIVGDNTPPTIDDTQPSPPSNDLTDEQKQDFASSVPNPDDDDNTGGTGDNFPYLGYIAGKVVGSASLFTNNLYTGLSGGGDAPLGSRGEARIVRGATNTLYSDGIDPNIRVTIDASTRGSYRYTDWGEWNGAGRTVPVFGNGPAERGFWVIGQSTHRDDIPTSGGATYIGHARGIGFNSETIGGTVSLNADFRAQTVAGSMDLTRQNGTAWVSLQTGSMSYTKNHDFEITFRSTNASVQTPGGTPIAGAGASAGGSFFGPKVEEIAGQWAVWGVPDAVGGADGVFRAKK